MVYRFLDKKTGVEVSLNEKLAEELHKAIIQKFKRGKVYEIFKNNVWAADLVEMVSLSSSNKNIRCLLCIIDVFTKYT